MKKLHGLYFAAINRCVQKVRDLKSLTTWYFIFMETLQTETSDWQLYIYASWFEETWKEAYLVVKFSLKAKEAMNLQSF